MAVKERKQITGTTAQINAYKGHEGQIVWDKEKKTLVGMSGTAGKNYPLAPKTYVDNEVAKVNTEVAKKASSAELTQGLAGKEDKGTCLPLTGGVVDGSLTIKDAFRLYASADEKLGTITSEPIGGAYLDLVRKDASVLPGSFALAARIWDPGTEFSKVAVLQGVPDGTLTWNGGIVPTVVQTKQSAGGAHTMLRFESGIQIGFGFVNLGKMNFEPWTPLYEIRIPDQNFLLPFISPPSVVASGTTYGGNNSVPVESVTATTTVLYGWMWLVRGGMANAGFHYMVMGRWK